MGQAEFAQIERSPEVITEEGVHSRIKGLQRVQQDLQESLLRLKELQGVPDCQMIQGKLREDVVELSRVEALPGSTPATCCQLLRDAVFFTAALIDETMRSGSLGGWLLQLCVPH